MSDAVTWADDDGDFLQDNGEFGNPGCAHGDGPAVVRVGDEHLCGRHADERGLVRPGAPSAPGTTVPLDQPGEDQPAPPAGGGNYGTGTAPAPPAGDDA